MSAPRIKRIFGQDYEQTKSLDMVQEAFSELGRLNPILAGEQLTGVVLGTSDTLIDHGLARPYQGFIVTRRQSASVVFESTTQNNIPDRQIILKGSIAATVDIYIF
jgi:hypothetical protein